MPFTSDPGIPLGHTLLRWRQTDGSATHGQQQACSAETLTSDTGNDVALDPTGTPGSSEITVTVDPGLEAAIFFETGAVGFSLWNRGIWTVQIDVTTPAGDDQLTIEGMKICRVNSSGVSQATLAIGGSSYLLDSPGVRHVVAVQEDDATASATDRVYIVLDVQNQGGSADSFGFTPNGWVVSPIRTVTHVAHHRERIGYGPFRAQVNVLALPPSVALVHSIAAPTAIVNAYVPTNVRVQPPQRFKA